MSVSRLTTIPVTLLAAAVPRPAHWFSTVLETAEAEVEAVEREASPATADRPPEAPSASTSMARQSSSIQARSRLPTVAAAATTATAALEEPVVPPARAARRARPRSVGAATAAAVVTVDRAGGPSIGIFKGGMSTTKVHDSKIDHGAGGVGGTGDSLSTGSNGSPGIAADVYPS
jgi:hypothetical protein